MKKSQFFLRFTFLTKKQQGEFGRYLVSLHPQKQTAIAIYQFYVAHGAVAKQLLLPRQDLAQLIFPKQKAQQVKLNNGLSDLNIVIEEYLHWMTKVKGVRNQQQDLALVEAFSKNGDEKGVDRVVGRLERQLEGETYKNLNHYEVYSKLMDLKIGIPFRKYRKEIVINYRKSAELRMQWANRASLTFMVEYECNHIVNGFEFDFPLRKELNNLLSKNYKKLDENLKLHYLMWQLYISRGFNKYDESKDEILNLVPDDYFDEKVEILKMLKNFISRNRAEMKDTEVRKAYFDLNNIQMRLEYINKRLITPTLFMNYMISSKGITDVKRELYIYKGLLPMNIREQYYELAINELAIYYDESIVLTDNLLSTKVKVPLYEMFRRRIILISMIQRDVDIDKILSQINNYRQYVIRNRLKRDLLKRELKPTDRSIPTDW